MVCGVLVSIESNQTGYADAFTVELSLRDFSAIIRAINLCIKYVSYCDF